MTFIMPRISNQGEHIYLSLSSSSGSCSCRRRWLRRLCQHPVQPIVCQYDIGVRQLCAFAAALRAPVASLMKLFVFRFLFFDKLIRFFPCTYSAYAKRRLKSCWHTTSVTLGKHPFPLYRVGTATPALRVGEQVDRLEQGTLRAIKHAVTPQGWHDLMNLTSLEDRRLRV